MKNVAIIMAGGKGERFWPMSTSSCPKQFLALTDSKKTMIQLTVERILPVVNIEDIFIVTNKKYKNLIDEQISGIPSENILFEPVAKNTAPCIAFATAVIKKKYNDANVIVLSSDHVIKNNDLFIENIRLGIKRITSNNIITIGIVPDRIETGYGYIKLGQKDNLDLIYKVDNFVEKPNYDVAKKYYESNNYLWNSGMFIWKNSFIESCIKKYIPDTYKKIKIIYNSIGKNNFYDIVKEQFDLIEPISIDYAILEKVDNIMVIPGNFIWDDVGSWLSVSRLKQSDINNNVVEGKVLLYGSNNNVIINNDKKSLISCVGLDDLIIVKTNNSILVMNKSNVGDIKNVIKKIKEREDYRIFL